MESSRPEAALSSPEHPVPSRPRSSGRGPSDGGRVVGGRISARAVAIGGIALALSVSLPAATGHADPGADPKPPSVKEMKGQIAKLDDQMEQLTERFNGLRVRLGQAERAAKVAADNAARQEKELAVVQERVGSLAATSYMNGGVDQTVVFATAQDPQAFLDQASTLNYFAIQDGTKFQRLAAAMQAAQRARKAAQDRAAELSALKKQADSQKTKVEETYNKLRDKIIKRSPADIVRIPAIGGSGKAVQALRAALTQLGDPYVWGAAGPNAFDCSGLTMWAYKQVGINLPHFTGSQWNAGTHVSRSELLPGDLVFFYPDKHHMGMYLGGGKMVHAPRSGDVVRIAPIDGRPFAGAVRVA
ncbi:MAG TPA: NlpC/P60 family protein [Streptosporangiaceae bacterium]|nr:NlpC/P60 family protein [Streptosporangiaceae bacterium]